MPKQSPYQIIQKKKKSCNKMYDALGKHSDYIVRYVWESKLTSGERNIISDIWAILKLFHGE